MDTIPPPPFPGDPDSPPIGQMIVGVNSAYTFDIRSRDGKVVRVQKAYTPVPVNPDERAELEAMNEWTRRTRAQFLTAEIPPVPSTKPAYRAFAIGDDGRIWVRLYTAALKVAALAGPRVPEGMPPPPAITWREEVLYDVFEPDGTYLGHIRMPNRTTLAAQRSDEIWALQQGEFDETYVVRYRIMTSQAR